MPNIPEIYNPLTAEVLKKKLTLSYFNFLF